jgi:hypothetical protein
MSEIDPHPGEIVPMDYPEHENTYKLFLRLLLFIIIAALVFLVGWMFWL